MNKPKDDSPQNLDEILTRFLSNDTKSETDQKDDAKFDDVELNSDKK